MQRHHRLGPGQIQLGEQYSVGSLDLRPSLLVARQLPGPGLGVDGADDARGDRRRRGAQPLEPVEDRPVLGDPGRLQHDHLWLGAPHDLGDRRPQLGLHANLVTDAAAGQLHHVTGPALDQPGVDVDPPELVDDHADPPPVLRAQHPVEERGLPCAEKPGEQDERRLAIDGGGHGARL
ncbi:MAG TPA: hypothetical protein VKZ18_11950 [Polyangia bacterium]|nr:hypothetical protein [Polyangia bacterium]